MLSLRPQRKAISKCWWEKLARINILIIVIKDNPLTLLQTFVTLVKKKHTIKKLRSTFQHVDMEDLTEFIESIQRCQSTFASLTYAFIFLIRFERLSFADRWWPMPEAIIGFDVKQEFDYVKVDNRMSKFMHSLSLSLSLPSFKHNPLLSLPLYISHTHTLLFAYLHT